MNEQQARLVRVLNYIGCLVHASIAVACALWACERAFLGQWADSVAGAAVAVVGLFWAWLWGSGDVRRALERLCL